MVNTPLWKQFYNKQKLTAQKTTSSDGKKEDDLQGFYQHLEAQRKGFYFRNVLSLSFYFLSYNLAQDLPPVFGMLTGPLLSRPYR